MAPATPHIDDTDGWVVYLSPNPLLLLVPEGGDWVAATSHTGAKVDLCREIAHGPAHVEFVDVELDVVWRWGEPARVTDMEEFQALCLPPEEADRYLAEAERIRVSVDAGEAPFGPAFRRRLIEVSGPAHPALGATWAGGVGPYLAGEVSEIVGPGWLARLRAGDGWLVCGGDDRAVTAVVWIGAGGEVLLAAEDPAMGSFLMDAAPSLRAYAPPPLPPPP